MERTICPVCKGSKKCPNCDGKGYKMEKVSILGTAPWKLELTGRAYEIKRKICRTCQGDGLCPECHGTGFIDDPRQEFFEQVLPHAIVPPDYSTLLHWWDAWPEARPELLDFWARGNYTRRLLSRSKTNRSGCIVRVEYVDEMEAALKRLALLDIDIDFAWCGQTTQPQLVLVPQDMEYEDSGGWGYMACAGSLFSERRGGKRWCPSFGWASLLPDTVTDWLAEQARPYIQSGKIIVSPVSHIGLRRIPGDVPEEQLQKMSNSASIVREHAKIEALFDLELPYIEGMSLQDIHKFCEDHRDSLILFQNALAKLLQRSIGETPDTLSQELVSQIREGVAELRLSDRTIAARKGLTALSASIATFLVTVGITLGVGPGAAAVGSASIAWKIMDSWAKILETQGSMRKNPFYVIWTLQKGKGPKNKWHKLPFSEEFPLPSSQKPKVIPPFHWLTPPTAGWLVPSARVV